MRGWGRQERGLDEYALRCCCNVMTSLMRSVESWGSHFVVSPNHSPAQEIQCGTVLRHIHSDGWMHLLMFQTTEHHSEVFLEVFYLKTPHPYYHRWLFFFFIPIGHSKWKKKKHALEAIFFLISRNTSCFVFASMFDVVNHIPSFIFVLEISLKWGKNEVDLSPLQSHHSLPPSLTLRWAQRFCSLLPSTKQRQQNNGRVQEKHKVAPKDAPIILYAVFVFCHFTACTQHFWKCINQLNYDIQ